MRRLFLLLWDLQFGWLFVRLVYCRLRLRLAARRYRRMYRPLDQEDDPQLVVPGRVRHVFDQAERRGVGAGFVERPRGGE